MNQLTKKWQPTGLLDGLKPEQLDEASMFLNRIAQEVISISSGSIQGTPEYTRVDTIAGIIIPTAREVFDTVYPKSLPDPSWLMKDFVEFFDSNRGIYDDLKKASYMTQDQDKEFQWGYMMDIKRRGKI